MINKKTQPQGQRKTLNPCLNHQQVDIFELLIFVIHLSTVYISMPTRLEAFLLGRGIGALSS
jgi:hypothetical protein